MARQPWRSKYDPAITPTLCYWMARSGLTLDQMAANLGTGQRTLDTWIARHSELRDAIRPGKDFIDRLVEGSLLKRALGYEYDEVTTERVPVEFHGSAPVRWVMKVSKRVRKHVPGDVGAQAFWLKNRCGWKDKYEHTLEGQVMHRFDLSRFTDTELSEFRRLAQKAVIKAVHPEEVAVAGSN